MKYKDLKNDIAAGAKGVYLLQGEDAYFIEHAEEEIKDAFLQFPELNYLSLDGENLKGSALAQLAEALQSFPFMAQYRVVRVRGFYPSEDDWNRYMAPLMENFPSTAILIISNHTEKKQDYRRKSDSAGKTKGKPVDLRRKGGITYVDCGMAGEEDVARWIYISLKRAGVYADVGVCMSIAQYCLCNMSRVSAETKKIIVYKNGGGTLTQEEADMLVYKDAEYRIYELTNAVAAGDYAKYIAIADDLSHKGMEQVSMLTALFNYFRTLATILSSDKSDSELADMLGMKEYGIKRSRSQAKGIGTERLSSLCSYIYGLLSDIKQGEVMPQSAFYLATSQIFFGGNRQPRL